MDDIDEQINHALRVLYKAKALGLVSEAGPLQQAVNKSGGWDNPDVDYRDDPSIPDVLTDLSATLADTMELWNLLGYEVTYSIHTGLLTPRST